MRLTQLQYLVEIKKYGSISKAAQHLYIAQPSMSTAIRELEEELGYELVKRSKRGVTFTNLGEKAVEKAVLIIQEVETLRCLNEVDTGHMSGRIFISAVPFVCEYFIVDLIVALNKEYPDLLLLLDETDGTSVIRQVSQREADIGVIMICSNEEERFAKELSQNNLVFDEVFQDEMVSRQRAKSPVSAGGRDDDGDVEISVHLLQRCVHRRGSGIICCSLRLGSAENSAHERSSEYKKIPSAFKSNHGGAV